MCSSLEKIRSSFACNSFVLQCILVLVNCRKKRSRIRIWGTGWFPCLFSRPSYELCAGLLDRPNRTKEQAVCDEIREELGYVVKPEDLEFVGRSIFFYSNSSISSRRCRNVWRSHVHVLRGSNSRSEAVSRRWFERGRGANFRIPRPSFRNGCFSRRLRPRKIGFDYDGNVLVASFTRKKLSCGQANKMRCLLGNVLYGWCTLFFTT